MGIDGKYGQVTTEYGDIGENEPVVVFRAQDGLLGDVLDYYYSLCRQAGSPPKHLTLISLTADTVGVWQDDPNNYVKNPPNSEGPAGRRLDF